MDSPPSPNQRTLPTVNRLVVKVGSAVVAPGGVVDELAIERLAGDIAGVMARGAAVVLVSSGAVAAGFRQLGIDAMPTAIRDKQAAAAIGQPRLVGAYAGVLARHGLGCAQVLVTADDFEHRQRFLNARHTLVALLEAGVLPIVNENDSVAFDEIRVGDNDRLSALVAAGLGADLLVVLSSVDGLRTDGGLGELVREVASIDDATRHVDDSRSSTGTGGFTSKLDAARIATDHGVAVVVARGPTADLPEPISAILDGKPIGTAFAVPDNASAPAARKSWIGYAAGMRGAVIIDDGAARALAERGASLLPSGVVGVEGDFELGAPVEVRTGDGRAIARGLASYAAAEIRRLMGCRSDQIETVLGYRYADEVIHRDDMLVASKDQP